MQTKTARTFRIENELLDALESISVKHGDITSHLETALRGYKPIKAVLKGKPKQAIEVPEGVNMEAWSEWEIYRRVDKKKTITPAAARKQFKLLQSYNNEQQQQIVDNSIQNDYQGLFDLKGVSHENRKQSPSGQLSAVERVSAQAELRERDRKSRESYGQAMDTPIRDIRLSACQPIRSDNAGELGLVINGDYARSD
jgi:hypothetical protein